MLNVTIAPAALDPYCALHGTAFAAPPAGRRNFADEKTQARLLADYLHGWAEADPVKIAAATAPGYCFDDPFVGTFSHQSLPWYFERLQARFAFEGGTRRLDLAFKLRGQLHGLADCKKLQFWREAPQLGLTGVTLIEVGENGVITEQVTYDLNLASDLLRRAFQEPGPRGIWNEWLR